jgi:hypothetical protein
VVLLKENHMYLIEDATKQPPCPPTTALSPQLPSPICHPERSQISCFTVLATTKYVVLLKENHTYLIEAATLNRKSGEAEGSAVPLSFATKLKFP